LLAAIGRGLKAPGSNVLTTREPGGTRLGEGIRGIVLHDLDASLTPLAEAMLMCAARAQLVDEVVRPALAAGQTVLCDRYALATLAYQGYGRGAPLEDLRRLNEIATRGCAPDVTFLLDIPVETSLERLRSRNASSGKSNDRMEREAEAFHQRVRAGYLELARTESHVKVLDGLREPEALAAEALATLERIASA